MHTEVATPVPSILIVDDNPSNLRLLADMLKDQGYKPRPVLSGEIALAAARLSPPDLILMDITMPDVDGFTVCKLLQEEPNLKSIPVLFISALNDATSKLNAFAAGGCDYITKPFQFEEVEARVRMQLELKRKERELQESYDQLQKLEALRDSLTHMVVHDMRGYLMAMMMSLDLSPSSRGGDNAHLERVRSGIHTLVEMTTLMLDINRLEALEMPLNKTKCDLQQIIASVIDSMSSMTGKRQLQSVTDIAITIECDAELIRRVLQNIVSNALKFTPPDGTVDIRVALDKQSVRVFVRDNGPGLSPEDQRRIFDKFQQAATHSVTAGTGLGLAFCKLAVEAHSGQIGVESTLGVGSTFWFSLPCAE